MERPEQETRSPPPGVLAAGSFDVGPSYHTRRLAGTRDWLITWTAGGAGEYRIGPLVHRCHAGEAVVLAPGVPHDYTVARGTASWAFSWAHFTPRPAWRSWLRLPEPAPGLEAVTVADAEARARIDTAFRRLVHDARGSGSLAEELALNGLEEALLLLARAAPGSGEPSLDPRVERVLERLTRDPAVASSLDELAASVALSPSRLAHLFRAEVGEPFQRVRAKLRLKQAARLLEHSSRSVAEIAADVGFESPFYFSRQFKAYYGLSPAHYRAGLRMVAGSVRG